MQQLIKAQNSKTALDSIAPVKVLLTQLFVRLQLKEETFKPITAVSEDIDAI